MNRHSLQGWIVENSLVRRAAEAALHAAGRRHLARLARLAPARCQRRILLGLLHQAQTTRFGRDHDFRRIRSIADYRRLVPLYTRADLWREYWQPVYPHLAGATWPGEEDMETGRRGDKERKKPLFSLSPRLPVSVSSCHLSALRTALALTAQVRPRARLLSGALLFLTDEGPSNRTEYSVLTERLPSLIRPYTITSAEIEAERFAHLPITGLVGPAERLLLLLEKIKEVRGKRSVRDIWPKLSAILYTRRPTAAPASHLRALAGEDVLLLEMVGRAEGPIAVEDPQLGLSRLLFDHGVYFEFVPLDQVDQPRCPRYDIEEIELGVPYELAMTSPAGLWACRTGRTVCLERRDPPLLSFVEMAKPQPAEFGGRRARRTDLVLPTPLLPASHPQSADIPEALPESSSHTPWSILADRG